MKQVKTLVLDRDDLEHDFIEFDEITLESFNPHFPENYFDSFDDHIILFTDYDLRVKILHNPYGNITLSKSGLIKVSFEDYEYSCGDGCCHEYGTIVKVNETELPNHNYQDPGNAVKQVLNYLGYNVEIDYL